MPLLRSRVKLLNSIEASLRCAVCGVGGGVGGLVVQSSSRIEHLPLKYRVLRVKQTISGILRKSVKSIHHQDNRYWFSLSIYREISWLLMLHLLCFWTLSIVLFFYLKHSVLETVFCRCLQVESIQFGPISISGHQHQHKIGYISQAQHKPSTTVKTNMKT
jgi:hypothetical protein